LQELPFHSLTFLPIRGDSFRALGTVTAARFPQKLPASPGKCSIRLEMDTTQKTNQLAYLSKFKDLLA
jgi:hypothetical protein